MDPAWPPFPRSGRKQDSQRKQQGENRLRTDQGLDQWRCGGWRSAQGGRRARPGGRPGRRGNLGNWCLAPLEAGIGRRCCRQPGSSRQRVEGGLVYAVGAMFTARQRLGRLAGQDLTRQMDHAGSSADVDGAATLRQRRIDRRRQRSQQDRGEGEPAYEALPAGRKAEQGRQDGSSERETSVILAGSGTLAHPYPESNRGLSAPIIHGCVRKPAISPASGGRCGTGAARAKRPGSPRAVPAAPRTSAACGRCAPGAAS